MRPEQEEHRESEQQVLPMDQFGAGVLRAAVTPARVATIVRDIVGEELVVGPIDVGPGGLASAKARGRRGAVTASYAQDDPARIRVRVAVALKVTVRMRVKVTRFLAHAKIDLRLRAEPCAPLRIAITVDEPGAEDVTLRLFMASKFSRMLLGTTVDVNAVLVEHICAHVRDLMSSATARQYTQIDLDELIERAWDHGLVTG